MIIREVMLLRTCIISSHHRSTDIIRWVAVMALPTPRRIGVPFDEPPETRWLAMHREVFAMHENSLWQLVVAWLSGSAQAVKGGVGRLFAATVEQGRHAIASTLEGWERSCKFYGQLRKIVGRAAHRSLGAFLRLLLSPKFFFGYLLLGLGYFLWIPYVIHDVDYGEAFFVTLALLTGSDPYSLSPNGTTPLKSYMLLWAVSWLIHVCSWLILPGIVGVIVSNTMEQAENERARQWRADIKTLVQMSVRDPAKQEAVEKEILDLFKDD